MIFWYFCVFITKAAALVHIYKDGSVLVSHGGTEMGQGIHTKVQQVPLPAFCTDLQQYKSFFADLICFLSGGKSGTEYSCFFDPHL